jgi:hypothetical protein
MIDVIFGIIVPGTVFAFSFVVTYLLFRHFSRHQGDE